MSNEEFIALHREDDVRSLMLTKAPEGIDLVWCARQIEGWQTARRKLPRWAATPGLHYPPRLSLEQCSSTETALYKRAQLARLLPEGRTRLVDLTGGLAVDFSTLAPLFQRATYVEMQPGLCELARHNLPLLDLPDAEIWNTSSPDPALWATPGTVVFLDPARRDETGRKTVAIEDCTPNILELQSLWAPCRMVMIKLSPMLDIAGALRQLSGVREVHVVSLRGECRELLLIIEPDFRGEPTYHCASLHSFARESGRQSDETGDSSDETGDSSDKDERNFPTFICAAGERHPHDLPLAPPVLVPGTLLFEPGPALLKADCQDAFSQSIAKPANPNGGTSLKKLHPMTNLFIHVGGKNAEIAPLLAPHGRVFVLEEQLDFGKPSLKKIKELRRANLTLRNFPGTAEALRRRLHTTDGGDVFLFATTLSDTSHALLRCSKWRSAQEAQTDNPQINKQL